MLPKEFPPALYWQGGKIRALSESSLIWACVTTSQRSSYKQKNSVHACAHLLCFPFLLVFHLSQLCFGFIPHYLIRMGSPTYASCCHKLLEFWLIKSEASSASALESALLPTWNTASALSTLLFTRFFPPSKPGWTQLLSSQGAQRKLSQAANWLAELLHLFIREQSWWSHGADVGCVHVRVCAG